MSVLFQKSRTKENLMRAFAGEGQARNRYTFSAGIARSQKLQVIEHIFQFTADQEKEHAEIFYRLLQPFSGENITINGAAYPVFHSRNVAELLRSAEHNECQEWEHDYREFAQIADEEGFHAIGDKFRQIAGIEHIHGQRFGHYAQLLEKGKLFVSDVELQWMCLNCGHIETAAAAPKNCPVCGHDRGYFIRYTISCR